ncbi:alpha/beta fold hydrolase [Saccharopolyspora pogona]|uniref:alpha/beta fold hydrolase n=1 Tax=Saccharopolyspora pogona TaxID=333966 RepID=UPI001CC25680|nr:hypothetical protein [Saccharopolyspora pogona]
MTWLPLRTPGLTRGASRYMARSATTIRRSMARNLAAGSAADEFDRLVELAPGRSGGQGTASREGARRLADPRLRAVLDAPRLPAGARKAGRSELVVAGRGPSTGRRPGSAAAAAAALRGRLKVIPGAGHLLPFARPDEFHRLTLDFLTAGR